MNTKPTIDELNDEALNDVAGGRFYLAATSESLSASVVASKPMATTFDTTSVQSATVLTTRAL